MLLSPDTTSVCGTTLSSQWACRDTSSSETYLTQHPVCNMFNAVHKVQTVFLMWQSGSETCSMSSLGNSLVP